MAPQPQGAAVSCVDWGGARPGIASRPLRLSGVLRSWAWSLFTDLQVCRMGKEGDFVLDSWALASNPLLGGSES